MNNVCRGAALSLAVLSLTLGPGCSANADQATDQLKLTLQQRLGAGARIQGVAKSQIPGLYEVNLGSQIIYSDAKGDYVLLGDLIDTRKHANLTEGRLAELNRIDFSTLPLDRAVKVVRGNGSRKIAVFSDPNCPYCRQLESTLKNVDDVTVYTFLYPVLSPDSADKSKAIWCSADRGGAWKAWMLERKAPKANASCDTSAIEKNLALGRELNVTGTPTVILANGRRLPGAVPADELNRLLSAIAH